jgi:hypothetical protein
VKKKVKKKTRSAEDIAMSTIDEEFRGESDRNVAIVGGAYLDALMTSLLRSVFITEQEDAELLLSEYGPLGSNGSRCKLAYCLGLIRKHQRDDLATVAKIRNKFAHIHTSLSFDDAPISDWCSNLQQARNLDAMRAGASHYKLFPPEVPISLSKGGDPITVEGFIKALTETPRLRFTTTVVTLAGSLLRRINLVSRNDEKTWFSKNPDQHLPI